MASPANPGRPALVVRLVFLTGVETQTEISAGEPARAMASMYSAAARALLWQTAELEGAATAADEQLLRACVVFMNRRSTIRLMWQTTALDEGTAESIVPQLAQAAWEDRVVNIIVCPFARTAVPPHDAAYLRRLFRRWARHAADAALVESSGSGEW